MNWRELSLLKFCFLKEMIKHPQVIVFLLGGRLNYSGLLGDFLWEYLNPPDYF